MKRKKIEKEVVHLLEWIIEYPGVWQIVCNPDGKETSPESFKMAYDMLVKNPPLEPPDDYYFLPRDAEQEDENDHDE